MKIVFALPGKQFSGIFLECWSDLLASCIMKGVTPVMRREYTSNVYLARNVTLKPGALEKGIRVADAAPLNGDPYDYIMWIDSDAVFQPEDFWRLVKLDVDIASGQAITNPTQMKLNWGMHNADNSACIWAIKGDTDKYPRDDRGLISVDFVGFHWMLVKKGVFEALEYPWFSPVVHRKDGYVFFPSEDIGWCMKAKAAGFKILLDPDCKIGHEKTAILKP